MHNFILLDDVLTHLNFLYCATSTLFIPILNAMFESRNNLADQRSRSAGLKTELFCPEYAARDSKCVAGKFSHTIAK